MLVLFKAYFRLGLSHFFMKFEFQIFIEFKVKIHIRMQNAAFEF